MSFRRPVRVLRQSPGTYGDDGRYTRGTSSEMAIMASVQPLGSRERYTVVGPEGGRNIAYIKVYTDVYLRPQRASEAGTDGQDADIIEWMGRHFMIVQCDAYQSGVISHYRAYAKEVLADDT